MNEADKEIVDRFIDALMLEEGLSANTLDSYRRDLAGFADWLAVKRGRLLRVTDERVREYLAARTTGGARPRTSARLLSSLKRF